MTMAVRLHCGPTGKKITLMSGIAAWQRDLKEYGVNQGFTIK